MIFLKTIESGSTVDYFFSHAAYYFAHCALISSSVDDDCVKSILAVFC